LIHVNAGRGARDHIPLFCNRDDTLVQTDCPGRGGSPDDTTAIPAEELNLVEVYRAEVK
jgi:hypothetical protein